jgi:hypothetical protein
MVVEQLLTLPCVKCSNGRIELEELKALLQSVDGGLQPVTMVCPRHSFEHLFPGC